MKNNINNKEMIDLFNNGKSCVEIANLFKCNPETIRLRLKKEGLDTSKQLCNVKCIYCENNSSKHGKTKYGKQRYQCSYEKCGKFFVSDKNETQNKMLKKHNEIKRMYLDEGLSTTQIADNMGVSSTVPQRILKKYGITRDISYAKELKFANDLGISYDEYLKRLPIFKKYRKRVIYYTNKQNISLLPNFNKRGKSGIMGVYQLDHKFSILEGFKLDISPEIIGNIANLEFIPWMDNLKKGSNCSITLKQLLMDIQVRVK